jgi:hypothetical protein
LPEVPNARLFFFSVFSAGGSSLSLAHHRRSVGDARHVTSLVHSRDLGVMGSHFHVYEHLLHTIQTGYAEEMETSKTDLL